MLCLHLELPTDRKRLFFQRAKLCCWCWVAGPGAGHSLGKSCISMAALSLQGRKWGECRSNMTQFFKIQGNLQREWWEKNSRMVSNLHTNSMSFGAHQVVTFFNSSCSSFNNETPQISIQRTCVLIICSIVSPNPLPSVIRPSVTTKDQNCHI